MSMSRGHLTLFTMLLLYMRTGNTVRMNMERRFADSSNSPALDSILVEYPYWQNILREFLFKTISPPPPSNNILYKEILEAPLYTGPFPAPETKTNDDVHERAQVLSRGDVFHLAKGGWIICQDGCIDCEICTVQKTVTVPAVKWTLRRIERLLPFADSKRHDLQLAVFPQNDGSFHMKNLAQGSFVYVTSNSGALASFTDTLIRGNDQYALRYPFGTGQSPTSQTPGDIFSPGQDEDVGVDREEVQIKDFDPGTGNEVLKITSTLMPKTTRKRGREVLQDYERSSETDDRKIVSEENSTPLTMFYPSTTPVPNPIDYDFGREEEARLILGRDQFGEKHLVHVVPAGEVDQGIKRARYSNVWKIHQQQAHPHPVYTEHQDHPLYRKIFRRVIDSLKTHRNEIENFLFSPKEEEVSFGQVGSSPIPIRTFQKEENPDVQSDEDSPMSTSGAEYDVESPDTIETTDNIEEIMEYGEESSSTSATTDLFSNEEGAEVSRANDQSRESNHHHPDHYLDEENLPDEFIKRQNNNSETLILKEVAKSVIDLPQGFNSLTDSLLPEPEESLLPAILDAGTTGITPLHEERKKKLEDM